MLGNQLHSTLLLGTYYVAHQLPRNLVAGKKDIIGMLGSINLIIFTMTPPDKLLLRGQNSFDRES